VDFVTDPNKRRVRTMSTAMPRVHVHQ